MTIKLTDKLYPYTVHVVSGHYFKVLVPFEYLNDFWVAVKKQKQEKVGEVECVCVNNIGKAFFRFIEASQIISVDDDQLRKEETLEDLNMDEKDRRTRNAQKKADKVIKSAKNKLSQKAKKGSF